jgi:HK97 family phage major capsid protein
MKVKKEDFGYNLDAIQDPEQKKFMESILGAMADIVNKATEGMLTQKDVDTQFNEINGKLKGYDADKFDQLVKDNEQLREMLKKSMDVIEKAHKTPGGMDMLSKFDEQLNAMFDSEKFQEFVEGKTRKSGAFDGFSLKDIVSITANGADGANYTGDNLISRQDNRYFSKYNPAKLHLRDIVNVLQGDPEHPTHTFGQVDSVDRNFRYVTENGELPESAFSLKEVVSNTARIGTHLKVSKRMLKSRIFVRSWLIATLPDRMYLAEDWGMLFGDGSGENLLGVANMTGCVPVETIITGPIVSIAAGGVSSYTSYNSGADTILEFAAPQPDIMEGMKITLAATGVSAANTTYDVIKMNDRQILLKGLAYSSDLSAAATTATVQHGAYHSIVLPNSADVIKTIIAVMSYAQYNPNAIVLNPITLNAIECEKDTTGRNLGLVVGNNGVKYIGGVPVIEMNSMPIGKYLVGDFLKAADLIDYTALSIEFAEDVNTKLKNYVAVIAQEEVIFPVYMPWAFAYGSLASVKTAITAS